MEFSFSLDSRSPAGAAVWQGEGSCGFVTGPVLARYPALQVPLHHAGWQPPLMAAGACQRSAADRAGGICPTAARAARRRPRGPRPARMVQSRRPPGGDVRRRRYNLRRWRRSAGVCGPPPSGLARRSGRRPDSASALCRGCGAADLGRGQRAVSEFVGGCVCRRGRAANADAFPRPGEYPPGVPAGGFHRHRPERRHPLRPRYQLRGLGRDAALVFAAGVLRIQPRPFRPDDRKFHHRGPLGAGRRTPAPRRPGADAVWPQRPKDAPSGRQGRLHRAPARLPGRGACQRGAAGAGNAAGAQLLDASRALQRPAGRLCRGGAAPWAADAHPRDRPAPMHEGANRARRAGGQQALVLPPGTIPTPTISAHLRPPPLWRKP